MFADVMIIDQQVYDINEGWINQYHRKGIQSFDHFIAINSKIRDSFINRFRIPIHRVSLIYHMLSDKKVLSARRNMHERNRHRQEIGIPTEYSKVFIFVGRLSDQKKPMTFLNLVRRAKKNHADCFFLMVGDGEMACECDTFISKEELTNLKRVHFHPCPPELMALADGMIITSIYEGLPIAMLEALGVGIPVLSTDVGDIRLFLERFNSGKIFVNDLPLINNVQADAGFDCFVRDLNLLTTESIKTRDEICSLFGENQVSKKYNSLFGSFLSK
jgi:glycosyltransferase involved in cell wall biosynthesis